MVQIRKDLQKQELGVPIGDIYFFGNEKLRGRWINEDGENETFQVFYNNQWLDAYSIDWDFIDEEIQ